MKRSHALVGVTAAVAAAALTVGPAATAGSASDPIAEGLVGPLQFTFDEAGRPLVAQGFAQPGVVSRVTRAGELVDVVQDDGTITGVAQRNGRIAYTLSGGLPEDVPLREGLTSAADGPFQLLKVQARDGGQSVIANLGRAEANRNPDAHQIYGWLDYGTQCDAPAPGDHAPRGGIVESNPYAVAAAPGGGWYVADAATNAIWKAKAGRLKVVSVLKPRAVTVTQAMVDDQGYDDCAVGTRYNYEPVPTDVEVAGDGSLYVSLLPGEGNDANAPTAGGVGAVVKVNPANGKSRTVASGFDSATNLAVAGNRVYVTELFAGRVSQINLRTGDVRPVLYPALPAAIERHDGQLYFTYETFPFNEQDPPNGKLALLDPSGPTQVP